MAPSRLLFLWLVTTLNGAYSALWERSPEDPVALDVLPWKSTCPDGIDLCGRMEFCAYDEMHWAFRLPGKKCLPGRGPTIRLIPGKKYQLTLNNTAMPGLYRHSATLHLHGLHIDVNGNSDNMTRVVQPTQCIKYTWKIPANHMGGSFIYYSVLHRSSEVQINGGAFGAVVVEDNRDSSGKLRFPAPPTKDVESWMRNELLLLGSKMELETADPRGCDIYVGHGYQGGVPLAIAADVWYRVRVVGSDPIGRPGQVVFGTNCIAHAVAYDGMWGMTVPINWNGSRLHYDFITSMEVALKCPEGEHNVSFFGGNVYTLVATAAATSAFLRATPFDKLSYWDASGGQRPAYQQDLRLSSPSSIFQFVNTEGYINGVAWNPAVPHQRIPYGAVVEWTLANTSSGPIHFQGYPMQVVTPGGCGWHLEGHWYTVISAVPPTLAPQADSHVKCPLIPPLPILQTPDTCRVRFRATDFGGRAVLRSQYYETGDWGSMAWVNVVSAPQPVDFTDIAPLRCVTANMCKLTGACAPAPRQCNSLVGTDNCGGPCFLSSAPTCPSSAPVCDTITDRCVQRLSTTSKPVSSTVVPPPTTLLTLPWNRTCPTVPAGVKPYDFCGDLEFCAASLTEFGFRLPGQPCRPAHSPIIRMIAGKKYQLWLHNKAWLRYHVHITNLHTHGIHISGDGNADDITRVVKPFQALRYTYDLPADHLGGTFWYHCHVHEITHLQVRGGAFGMLIVEDPPSFKPSLKDRVDPFLAYLKNEVPLIGSRVGNTFLGNGNPKESLYIKAQEWYRLRFVGVDPEVKPKDLIIGDSSCDVHKMQNDGVWSTAVPSNVIPRNLYTMSGANRVEVAIRCSQPGEYPIRWFGGLVARLVVSASSKLSISSPWAAAEGKQWSTEPLRPPYLRTLLDYSGELTKWSFDIRHGFINDLSYNEIVPHRNFPFNGVVEWKLIGTAGHVFHLHIWHMQVVTPGGCGFHEYGQWYDAISASDGGDCTVRFQMVTWAGRAPFHCHYLKHEDLGTMGWVNVTYNSSTIDHFQIEPVPSDPNCTWDQITCSPYHDCGSNSGYDNCGNDCTLPVTPTCPVDRPVCNMNQECVVDILTMARSTGTAGLPSMYSQQAQEKWGYPIGHMDQISSQSRTALAALVLSIETRERVDYFEGFHAHVPVHHHHMLASPLPVTVGDTNTFDAAITAWGNHEVVRAVATSFTPTKAAFQRLGISERVGSYRPILLLQVDRLLADGRLANGQPLELRIRFAEETPFEVFLHDANHLDGVPVPAPSRSNDSPFIYNLTIEHSGLISIFAPITFAAEVEMNSNPTLWIVLGVLAAIVFVSIASFFCWHTYSRRQMVFHEYTETCEGMVENHITTTPATVFRYCRSIVSDSLSRNGHLVLPTPMTIDH